jgi:hypothetical protein
VSSSVPGEAASAIVGGAGGGVTVTVLAPSREESNVERAVIVADPAATPVTSAVSGPVDVTVARVASEVSQTISIEAPPSATTTATSGTFDPTCTLAVPGLTVTAVTRLVGGLLTTIAPPPPPHEWSTSEQQQSAAASAPEVRPVRFRRRAVSPGAVVSSSVRDGSDMVTLGGGDRH